VKHKDAAQALRDFVADNEIATLNVAGPRASKEPELGEFVKEVLEAAFPAWCSGYALPCRARRSQLAFSKGALT
jgi:hypothetical protein